MNLLSTIKSLFKRETRVEYVDVPQARYEASYSYFGDKSLIPAALQDSRFDATPGVRMELARKSRYWERNSAVMNRLCDLFEQYTVGPTGLRLIPNSGSDATPAPVLKKQPAAISDDPTEAQVNNLIASMEINGADWNTRAAQWWKNWCRSPEIDSLRSFNETQSLIARSWFVDGEAFILKTADAFGAPKIQLIESHRVATPTEYASLEGSGIVDGVEINSIGAPIAYHVRKANLSTPLALFGNTINTGIYNAPEEFERIPASRIVHVFEAPRAGLTRGLPFNYSVLNDLHDFEDLQIEECKAVKSAADLACIWHTKTGEVPDTGAFRRKLLNIQTQDASGNAVTKQSSVYYDSTQGGRDRYLKPGEDVKQFLTERPTVATQWFYDYLLAKICAGCGISKLLVMPYSNQGTVVRSDLDTNSRFFLSRSAVLAKVFVELYLWAMGWAKDWDRSLIGAPKDWDRVICRPPRSVNVDIGRNSAAMLAELEAGVRTRADIWAELGEDWQEQTEQSFKEAAFIKAMEGKYGVTKEEAMPGLALPAPPMKPANGVAAKIPIKINGNGHHEKENLFAHSRS